VHRGRSRIVVAVRILCAVGAQTSANAPSANGKQTSAEKKAAQKQAAAAKPLSPTEELQKAISDAETTAVLVKNPAGIPGKISEARSGRRLPGAGGSMHAISRRWVRDN